MKILLNTADVVTAITAFMSQQLTIANDTTVSVDLKNGTDGVEAVITLVPKGQITEVPQTPVRTRAPNKPKEVEVAPEPSEAVEVTDSVGCEAMDTPIEVPKEKPRSLFGGLSKPVNS